MIVHMSLYPYGETVPAPGADEIPVDLSEVDQKLAADKLLETIGGLLIGRYGKDFENNDRNWTVRRVILGDHSSVAIQGEADTANILGLDTASYHCNMTVFEISPQGRQGNMYRYDMASDGSMVVRSDMGDWKKRKKELEHSGADTDEILQALNMPVSQQVVSPDEVEKIAALLAR